MSARPITQDEIDQVRALHEQGLSRNEIARRINRSGRAVSRICADLGLTFDRTAVAAATEARKADAASRRAALALALLDDVDRLRAQMWAPAVVYNFGGRDNTFEQRTLPEPDFRAKRDLMTSIGVAIDRSVKLDAYDRADAALAGVDAWLAAMVGDQP